MMGSDGDPGAASTSGIDCPTVAATKTGQAVRSGAFVDGGWRPPSGSGSFVVEDPATAEPLAVVGESTPEDADAALGAAHRAAGIWAGSAPRLRADVLRRAYELVLAHADELAALITAEAGKRLSDARAEVRYGAEFLRWYSEEAVRTRGRFGSLPEGWSTMSVDQRPVGTCLLLTPWNFPLAMVTRKVAPALAAGCTVVVKPSELTPLTCYRLLDLLGEAGLPAGVVNVFTTTRPGPLVAQLLDDPRLRKVGFTGSTTVGRVLLGQAAGRVLRTSMELGGDAPLLVLSDADVDRALEGTMIAKFRGGGQACTAANRILVHSAVADEYLGKLAERVASIRAGRGDDPGSGLGPLISRAAVDRTRARVGEAVSEGAEVLAVGEVPALPGYFHPATVLAGVRPDGVLRGVEWFAPVAAVTVFDDDDELVAAACDSEYGLASYVFTGSAVTGRRVARRLEVGMTAVNTGLLSNAAAPFGGVRLSGHGREGGPEGLAEYLEAHYLLEYDS